MSYSFPQQSSAQPPTGARMQPPPLSPYPYGGGSSPYVPFHSVPPPSPRTGVEKAALILTIIALPVFYVVTIVSSVVLASMTGMPGSAVGQTVIAVIVNPVPYLLLVGLIQLTRRRPSSAPLSLIGVMVPMLGLNVARLLINDSLSPGPVTAGLNIVLAVLVIVTGIVVTAASTHGPRPRPKAVTTGIGSSVFLGVSSALSLVQAPLFLMLASRRDPGGHARSPELGLWLAWDSFTDTQQRAGLPLATGLVVLIGILALSIASIVTGVRRSGRAIFLLATICAAGLFTASQVGVLVLGTGGLSFYGVQMVGEFFGCGVALLLVVTMALLSLAPSARQWFSPSTGTPAQKDSSSMVAS